jgi:hypothetical protein
MPAEVKQQLKEVKERLKYGCISYEMLKKEFSFVLIILFVLVFGRPGFSFCAYGNLSKNIK